MTSKSPSTTPSWGSPSMSGGDDIGKIDHVNYTGTCLSIETGGLLKKARHLIPATAIRSIDLDDETIDVTMTAEEVEQAPVYDDARDRRARRSPSSSGTTRACLRGRPLPSRRTNSGHLRSAHRSPQRSPLGPTTRMRRTPPERITRSIAKPEINEQNAMERERTMKWRELMRRVRVRSSKAPK